MPPEANSLSEPQFIPVHLAKHLLQPPSIVNCIWQGFCGTERVILIICMAGTRLDFNEAPYREAIATQLKFLANPLEHNSEENPGWSYYDDSKKNKTGWIITHSTGTAHGDTIGFHIKTGNIGRLTVGYLRTYPSYMESANITLLCDAKKVSMVLNSKWDQPYSLYQDEMFENLPLQTKCVVYVRLITDSVNNGTRRILKKGEHAKFKLLLLLARWLPHWMLWVCFDKKKTPFVLVHGHIPRAYRVEALRTQNTQSHFTDGSLCYFKQCARRLYVKQQPRHEWRTEGECPRAMEPKPGQA